MKRSVFNRLCHNRGDPHYLEAFRQVYDRARRILKETQHNSWMSYLSSITTKTPLAVIFNKVRKISGKFSPTPHPILLSAGEKVA